MRAEIELQDIGNLITCISDYKGRGNSFTQMGGAEEYRKKCKEYWETKVIKRTQNTWLTDGEYKYWNEINFHTVVQTWGSTAGGWPGMGGAMLTSSYTHIIENLWSGLAFVYYGSRLAYICEMDSAYLEFMSEGYRGLPDYTGSSEKLNVLYKTSLR